jgi:hypothetical protein
MEFMNTKNIILFLTIAAFLCACAPDKNSGTASATKDILVEQLKSTHTKKDWFVPVNVALEGVTAEQAMWRDSSGNHSIGQLAHHLLFWNKRQLAKFNGLPEGEAPASNDETFDAFTKDSWEKTVSALDSVMAAIENTVQQANDEQLKAWSATIANISVHNAYHTGQIVFVRKLQQSWDPEKGVR